MASSPLAQDLAPSLIDYSDPPPSQSIRSSRVTSNFSSSFTQDRDAICGDHDPAFCWACESPSAPTGRCHVLGKNDIMIDYFEASNLILSDYNSNEIAKFVFLCPSCHSSFDRHDSLGFIFFPTDLQYFIDYEIRDRQERATTGRPRRVPTEFEYYQHQKDQNIISPSGTWGLYSRIWFHLRDPLACEISPVPKTWHGRPINALRRAFPLPCSPQFYGLPVKTREQIKQLADLYFDPDSQGLEPSNSYVGSQDDGQNQTGSQDSKNDKSNTISKDKGSPLEVVSSLERRRTRSPKRNEETSERSSKRRKTAHEFLSQSERTLNSILPSQNQNDHTQKWLLES